MALTTALFTGVSGLSAMGTALSVIGDNISNSNTIGYKGSNAQFGDVLSQAMGGSSSQIGRGTYLQGVTANFGQGTLQTSANPLDLAIQGEGFFIVKDAEGATNYTRAGQFTLDKEGNIVNTEGLMLQGYLTQKGGQSGTVNVSSVNSPPNKTVNASISTNLNAAEIAKDPSTPFIVDSSNNTIMVQYDADGAGAGAAQVARQVTIASGSYDAAEMVSALETALNATYSDIPGTFTVSFNDTATNPLFANKFNITVNTAGAGDFPAGSTVDFIWDDATTNASTLLGFTSGPAAPVAAGAAVLADSKVYGTNPIFHISAANQTIVFHDGTALRTATIDGGDYTGAALAAKINLALEAANASAAGTYPVSYDDATNKFTITNASAAIVKMKWDNSESSAAQILGFSSTEAELGALTGTQTSDYASTGFDPSDASNTSNFATSLTLYDSLGNSHIITTYFRKTADQTELSNSVQGSKWHYYSVVPATDSATGNVSVGAQGILEFDTLGRLVSDTEDYDSFNFAGSVTLDQAINIDFGKSIAQGGTGLDGTTQYGSPSSVMYQSQDGYGAGSLSSLLIDQTGVMTGVFTNGQKSEIAKLSLAKFLAPGGLNKIGRNLFGETAASGQPIIGEPGSSGRGRILSSSLEMSNVDIADEFVKMITAQRAFQSNTKVISTVDQMMNDMLAIMR